MSGRTADGDPAAATPHAQAQAHPCGSGRKRLRIDWGSKTLRASADDDRPGGRLAVKHAQTEFPGGANPATASRAPAAGCSRADSYGMVQPEDLDAACACLGATRADSPKPPRVAIATCTRGCPAPRLCEWLFWHLSEGVQLILLRWEGSISSEHRRVMRGPLQRGELDVTFVRRASGGFDAVMGRQVRFVHRAMATARARGFDFVLHLDDDELVCPRQPSYNMMDVLRHHMGTGLKCIHFANLEAVFPFSESTNCSFFRPQTRFRDRDHVLYCNGKSAANLTARGDVFCSGVHHFCRYDRTFKAPAPEFGEHDECSGCAHPSCCFQEKEAFVLHFDCPSFVEWQAKFSVRAQSKLLPQDLDEMQLFPFKRESVEVLQRPHAPLQDQRRVYRRWRCLPGRGRGRSREAFSTVLTGDALQARLLERLREVRKRLS